jgi:hypothetical protein
LQNSPLESRCVIVALIENYSTSKPLKVSPEKSQILSCDSLVANKRYRHTHTHINISLIWLLIIWHLKLLPRPDVLLTVTYGACTDSMPYLGLSGCYVTMTNFLSKQETLSFHMLVLYHNLVVSQATGRSYHLYGAIQIPFLLCYMSTCYALLGLPQQLQKIHRWVNKVMLARGNT